MELKLSGGPGRLIAAAATLGTSRGVGALSIQAIAAEAGVSKALVLYHFTDKASLLAALFTELASKSAERLLTASSADDPLNAWRALVHREVTDGALALLAALGREAEVRGSTAAALRKREAAATSLAIAVAGALDLRPRVEPALLGCALLRHLDGIALRAAVPSDAPDAVRVRDAAALDAEVDSFALALLALAH